MASFRSKAVALLSIAGVAIVTLASNASAGEAPAPSPVSGAAVLSVPVAAAFIFSSAAIIVGALRA